MNELTDTVSHVQAGFLKGGGGSERPAQPTKVCTILKHDVPRHRETQLENIERDLQRVKDAAVSTNALARGRH
eukprot:scaffold35660_cov30-Prasinocladus_malaysianus.AAC.1